MTIDDRQKPITQNLFDGLKRLRRSTQYLLIWIDAVCINQDDLAERSGQVARMAPIYRNAFETMIWLGEGASEEKDRLIHSILGRLQECDRDDSSPDNGFRAIIHGRQAGWCSDESVDDHGTCKIISGSMQLYDTKRGSLDSQFLDLLPEHKTLMDGVFESLDAVHDFVSRRYWRRRWIIQEIILSDRVSWHWGACSVFAQGIGMSDLYSISLAIADDLHYLLGSPSPRSETRTFPEWSRICRQIMRRSTNVSRLQMGVLDTGRYPYSSTLVQALSDYAENDCSDPRDRIYALLSLDARTKILPNYTLSTVQVYTQFATSLVDHKMLKFLLVQLRTSAAVIDDLVLQLPSWVPDFRKSFLWQVIHEPMEALVSQTSDTLRLRVWCLDHVQQIEPKPDNFRGSFLANISGYKRDWVLDRSQERGNRSFDMKTGDLLCSTNRRLEGEMTTTPGVIDLKTGEEVSRPSSITEMLLLRLSGQLDETYQIVSTFESNYLRSVDETAFDRTAPLSDDCEMTVNIV